MRTRRVAWLSTAAVTTLAVGAVAPLAAASMPATQAVTCNFKLATIVGTSGSDTLVGTAADDVIAARGGNDVVRGLGGEDTICLGRGRDAGAGGAHDDTFVSETAVDGSDSYVGNAGRDRVSYLTRVTSIHVSIDGVPDDGQTGEGDNVRLSVEDITGSQAGDTIIGSDVDNTLDGGNGKDDLRGAVGNDTIRGGNDNDLMIGNAGADFMFGNTGDDTALAAAVEDGADFFEGETGIDTASYVGRSSAVRVNIDNLANDGAVGEGDDIRLDVENVEGGSGNDMLNANRFQGNPNRLAGNAGSDAISTTDPPFLSGDVADGGNSSDLCFTDNDDTRLSCEF